MRESLGLVGMEGLLQRIRERRSDGTGRILQRSAVHVAAWTNPANPANPAEHPSLQSGPCGPCGPSRARALSPTCCPAIVLAVELTADRKSTFLAELARHGIVARAARAASPHSENGCVMSFRDLREADPDFAVAWDEALEQAKGNVESELHRRAVEGWEEPIYGGRHREQIVGTVRRYSDRLLELRAKALLPEYRDRSKVELDGGLEMSHSGQQEIHHVLSKLTRDQRARLRELLTRAGEVIDGRAVLTAVPESAPGLAPALPEFAIELEPPGFAAVFADGPAVHQTEGHA